ncbi:MAG: hypothetical protein ABIT01_15890 [Thermoanaerobaculia bacterium]
MGIGGREGLNPSCGRRGIPVSIRQGHPAAGAGGGIREKLSALLVRSRPIRIFSPLRLTALAAAAITLAAATSAQAAPEPQPGEFKAGETVSRVACLAAPEKTYALYLPTSYDPVKEPGRKWPVLYLFDARGQGLMPLGLFREAAERFSTILVSSNDTRSDIPFAPNLAAIQALVADSHRRFALDTARRYAAGFSGGGRMAAMLAFILKGSLAGSISCGAGYAENYPPRKEMPVPFYGTIGDEDFNFLEMQLLERTLTSLSVPHRITVFSGPHRWPDASLCADALEWMQVQAARAGLIAKTDGVLDDRLARERRQEAELRQTGQLLAADRRLEAIVRDFDGLRDVAAEKAALAAAVRSSAHKKLAAEEDALMKRERQVLARQETLLQSALAEEAPAARLVRDLGIGELKQSALEKDRSAEGKLASRALASLIARTSDLTGDFLEKKQPARAALCLSVGVEIRPQNSFTWYNLACAQAIAGQRARALTSLTRATELGLPRGADIEGDPDLASLRTEPAYRDALARLKAARDAAGMRDAAPAPTAAPAAAPAAVP